MMPIHLDIVFLHLHNYEGLYFLTAILSGIIYTSYLCKKEGVNIDVINNAIFISLIAAIVCGRLFSVFFWNTKEVINNPLVIFKFWEGGITVTGGVFGGLIAGFIYAKIKKLDFFYYSQFIIPSIIIGHIIGRFGCFLNGDASGLPTAMPWGIVFPIDSIAYYSNSIIPGTPLHPTQLYEITGNVLLLFFVILTGNNNWIKIRRVIWYAVGYSSIRFIVEFFRNDSNRWEFMNCFTTGQVICFIGIVLGLTLFIWSLFNNKEVIKKSHNLKKINVNKQMAFAIIIIFIGLTIEISIALFAKYLSKIII